MPQIPLYFESAGERLAGELWLPDAPGPHPAVLLIGGTISDTRDGDPAPYWVGSAAKHGMLRVMAEHLAASGIASFRWDKRGVGESTGPDRLLLTDMLSDVDDAEQALAILAAAPGIDSAHLAVLGESAGAHVASVLAARTDIPQAYVLQGALYDSIPAMLEYNYDRIRKYCERGADAKNWVKRVARNAYRTSLYWREALAAALRGDESFEGSDGDVIVRFPIRRWKSELAYPPAEQFHFIQKPALVIQGACDMNVPPDNCYKVAETLRQSGNMNVTLVVVPGADHSMQMTPEDPELRLRERISLESFARRYSQFFLHALAGWLRDQLIPTL